jgi:hypothetical protein
MKKTEAINLFVDDGWAKADAERALEGLDFSKDPNELTVYKYSSLFSGKELIARQRSQAAQKGMVTKKVKEIDLKVAENTNLQNKTKELTQVKDELEKENRYWKNIVDKIRLSMTIDGGKLLKLEDSEIRKVLARWLKGIQG